MAFQHVSYVNKKISKKIREKFLKIPSDLKIFPASLKCFKNLYKINKSRFWVISYIFRNTTSKKTNLSNNLHKIVYFRIFKIFYTLFNKSAD